MVLLSYHRPLFFGMPTFCLNGSKDTGQGLQSPEHGLVTLLPTDVADLHSHGSQPEETENPSGHPRDRAMRMVWYAYLLRYRKSQETYMRYGLCRFSCFSSPFDVHRGWAHVTSNSKRNSWPTRAKS